MASTSSDAPQDTSLQAKTRLNAIILSSSKCVECAVNQLHFFI